MLGLLLLLEISISPQGVTATGPFTLPFRTASYTVTQYYSDGPYPSCVINGTCHPAYDLVPSDTSQIVASAGGRAAGVYVSGADCWKRFVLIHHPDGRETIYAHLSAVDTALPMYGTRGDAEAVLNDGGGTAVNAGQNIGTMGNAGCASGMHLHFEVQVNGAPLDPGAPDNGGSGCTQPSALWTSCHATIASPTDSDGDGIPDATDACQSKAEDINANQDEDGCPDTASTEGLRGDFNGDGFGDLVQLLGDYGGVFYGQPNNTWQLGNLLLPGSGFNFVPGRWRVGDFNGDGRSDLVQLLDDYAGVFYGQTNNTWQLGNLLLPGSGFNFNTGQWRVGDFNGDGASDLIQLLTDYAGAFYGQPGNTWHLGNLLLPGSGFNFVTGEWRVGDFNGDTVSDLIQLLTDYAGVFFGQPNNTWQLGNLLLPGSGFNFDAGQWRVGDFNGDGASDLIQLLTDYAGVFFGQPNNTWQLGNLFLPGSGFNFDAGQWRVGDFNGDGASDLIQLLTDYAGVFYGQPDNTWQLGNLLLPGSGFNFVPGEWRVGDFNGDGASDLIQLLTDYAGVFYGQPGNTWQFGNLLLPGSGFNFAVGQWIGGNYNADADGDSRLDASDNCPIVRNVDQFDADADADGNACDNCPNWANPPQTLPDWPIPLGDSDCDGFPGSIVQPNFAPETYIGTDPTKQCAQTSTRNDEAQPDAWPMDFDDNRRVNGQDILAYNLAFGLSTSGPAIFVPGVGTFERTRFDLSGNGLINGQDILRFNFFFGKVCV
jgi:hypothetical protein